MVTVGKGRTVRGGGIESPSWREKVGVRTLTGDRVAIPGIQLLKDCHRPVDQRTCRARQQHKQHNPLMNEGLSCP